MQHSFFVIHFKTHASLNVFAEENMAKSHRTLTSSKASHIKKRQLMSSLFGDYRAKMAEEESKMKTGNICGELVSPWCSFPSLSYDVL